MKLKEKTGFVDKCLTMAPKFFAVAMVLCTLFLLIGEIVLPDERDAADRNIQYMEAEWYRITEEGQKEPIEIPVIWMSRGGEWLR